MARGRIACAIFAAEQRALWPDPQRDGKARRWRRRSPITIFLVVLAWFVYWSAPGTWRRAPDAMRAFLRVTVWWNIVRLVTWNREYPWKRRR